MKQIASIILLLLIYSFFPMMDVLHAEEHSASPPLVNQGSSVPSENVKVPTNKDQDKVSSDKKIGKDQNTQTLPQEVKLEDRNIVFKDGPAEKKADIAALPVEEKKQDTTDSKIQYIKKIEPELSSYVENIEPISPDGNDYLLSLWPRSKKGIEPYYNSVNIRGQPVLDDSAKDDDAKLRHKPSISQSEQYRETLKKLNETKFDDPYQLLLKANLKMILAENGVKKYYAEAFKEYSSIYKNHSTSKIFLDSVYNMAFIMLRSGRFLETIEIVNKHEADWAKDKIWTQMFRSLIMETYYNRKRYVKAEDYLWMLATRIEKSELSQHLALRYSDSLFWQHKYLSMVEWQKSEQVSKYFDDSSPWVQISNLYLAEAFFQIYKFDEAKKRFDRFKEVYQGKYNSPMLDFRILQCEMMLSKDYKSFIPRFYNFSLNKDFGMIQDAARVQWARLVSREAKDGEAILSEAHAIMTALLTQIEDLQLIKETVYVKALLTYRLGEYRRAIDTLAKIYPRRFIKSLDEPFLKSVANFAVFLIERVAPDLWEKKKTVEFLVLVDRFTYAVQNAYNKSSLLFWVGRAYVENGMTGSAVHIFQKLLKELNSPHRVRTSLELAKAYGLMGNTEAMGRALELIKEVPEKSDEKALYYLTRATYQMTTKNYSACAEDLDQLLIRGVQGDELFKFALEGAICARKAKQFDRATKLVGLLDTSNENLLDSSLPKNLHDLHQKGLFEKINILAETQKYQQAVETFYKVKSSDELNAIEPPLETVFLVIDCLRKIGKPDDALDIWKQYAAQTKSLPKGFGDQFTRLLELLATTELVPLANQTGEGELIQ